MESAENVWRCVSDNLIEIFPIFFLCFFTSFFARTALLRRH